ncbi:MAG: right-handed parallel beta-helix repeat-containing protein [Roseibacillus sp.]
MFSHLKAYLRIFFFSWLTVFELHAQFVVTNTDDSGAGSLRAAIASGNKTVTFDESLNGTVITVQSPLVLDNEITITASSLPDGIRLSGSGVGRILEITTLSPCNLRGLTLEQGFSTSGAGAVLCGSGTVPFFVNCIFTNNSTLQSGGAVYCAQATPTFENCIFLGNSAGSTGGGLTNQDSVVTLRNCTLTQNSSINGAAAIHSTTGGSSITTLRNTIVWDNSVGGNSSNANASISFGGGNVARFQSSMLANYNATTLDNSNVASGSNFSSVDPQFRLETSDDLRLLQTSPLLNGGNNAWVDTTGLDVYKLPRLVGTNVDLGAAEARRLIYVDIATNGGETGDSWADAFTSLQEALFDQNGSEALEVWVAEGVYLSSDGVPSNAPNIFTITEHISIYGGFPSGGGDGTFEERNNKRTPSILTRVLSAAEQADPFISNEFRDPDVIDMDAENAPAILDGFTITGGRSECSGECIVRNCHFTETKGVGLFVLPNYSPPPPVLIEDCEFTKIESRGLPNDLGGLGSPLVGGALRIQEFNQQEAFSMVVRRCSFRGNLSRTGSPGISTRITFDESRLEIEGCEFTGNVGITTPSAIESIGFHQLSIRNSTFHGNSSVAEEGSLFRQEVIVASPPFGQSLLSRVSLAGCVVSGNNFPGNISVFYKLDGDPQNIHIANMIEGLSASFLNNLSIFNSGNIDESDPLFFHPITPGDSPQLTADVRIAATSPLLDGLASNPNKFDRQGNPRNINGSQDIGAYEGGNIIHVDAARAGGDGSGWTQAMVDLQDALDLAETRSATIPAQEIWVAAGEYLPDEGSSQTNNLRDSTFHLLSGVRLQGGYPSLESGLPADRDFVANRTTLSGDIDGDGLLDDNCYHVVTATDTDCLASLDGFTVTGGNANSSSTRGQGAGLYIAQNGRAHFESCQFLGNSARFGGGAFVTAGSFPSFTSCLFSGNAASNDGGALVSVSSSLPVLTNCTLQGNTAQRGGALALLLGSVELCNTIIWNNAAADDSLTTNASLFMMPGGEEPTFSHSLIANWSKSSLDSSGGSPATNLEPVDPSLQALVDLGEVPTDTGDSRLTLSSPLFNLGKVFSDQPLLDANGQPRFRNGTPELGAFEQDFILIYVDDTAVAGANNGTSWENAYLSLDNAIGTSQQNLEGRIFYLVAEGQYSGGGGHNRESSVFGGFPNGGSIFTARSPEDFETIINSRYQVSAVNSSPSVTLDGLIFEDERVSAVATDLTLKDCTFRATSLAAFSQDEPGVDGQDSNISINGCQFLSEFGATRVDLSNLPGSNASYRLTMSDTFFQRPSLRTSGSIASIDVLNTRFQEQGTPINSFPGIGLFSDLASCLTSFIDCAFDAPGGLTLAPGTLTIQDSEFIDTSFTHSGSSTITSSSFETTNPSIQQFVFISLGDTAIGEIKDCEFTVPLSLSIGAASSSNHGITNTSFSDITETALTILNGTEDEAAVTLDSCDFTNNSSDRGGALSANGVTAENCRFRANEAASFGGAVHLTGGESVFTSCQFSGNSVSQISTSGLGGGGAFRALNADATFTNCIFSGNESNHPNRQGGVMRTDGTGSFAFINCLFQGNSGFSAGAIYQDDDGVNFQFSNCVSWENFTLDVPGGVNSPPTPADPQSYFYGFSPNVDPDLEFLHCMIEHFDGSELDSFPNSSNNLKPKDPLFVGSILPAAAPTTAGNFRLTQNSPLLDVGFNGANSTSEDIAGLARVFNGIIDIGPYEFDPNAPVNDFASLFPGLVPNGDANQNGLTNFEDYASGADPTLPHDPDFLPCYHSTSGNLTFRSRNDVVDFLLVREQSTTLLQDSWVTMQEGVHYQLINETDLGLFTSVEIQILSAEPKLFFRLNYTTP